MQALVIINPIAGTGGRPRVVEHRRALAARVLRTLGIPGDVVVTERSGHAAELARMACAAGVPLVIAWGGDGTVNETASALAFSRTVLGIVPAGSGNGLARDLRISFDPEQALRTAVRGTTRVIDLGDLGGRVFGSVAGLGLDARVAARFNARQTQARRRGAGRRGLLPYIAIAASEVWSGRSDRYTFTTAGSRWTASAMLVAIANSSQYGNRARIAPAARIDDGLLDLVIVEPRSAISVLWTVRRLFTGTVDRVRGIRTERIEQVEIASEAPIAFHVDGEPGQAGQTIVCRVHPAALRVRTPGAG